MPTQEFHVDAVACVETAPLPGLRQWWSNSKGGPSGTHPVRQPLGLGLLGLGLRLGLAWLPNPNPNPNPHPNQ
eukprot:scaffold20605_cov69-Phaeocystis_antarctica.AAC.1